MSEVKETKKVVLSVLTKQVEDGMKKAELAAFYGLPVSQMTKLLKVANLKIRKFHAPAFELENDLENSGEEANLGSLIPETEEKEEAPVTETVTEEPETVLFEEKVADGGWGDEKLEDAESLESLLPKN